MMKKMLANERAKFAFEKIKEVEQADDDSFSKYYSMVRSFPAMILRYGYGPAMAFLYTKGDVKKLYQHIGGWLVEQKLLQNNNEQESVDLMEYIAKSDKDTYRLLENETMALLEWLKRFAEGKQDETEGEKGRRGTKNGNFAQGDSCCFEENKGRGN